MVFGYRRCLVSIVYILHNGFIYTILEYDLVQTFNASKSVDAPESPGKLEDAPIGVPALVTGIQTPLRETPPAIAIAYKRTLHPPPSDLIFSLPIGLDQV
jgi:hypothetical protein